MGKSIRKIVNWKQYNQALVSRGSLTFWVDEAAVKAWYCHEHHGGRGRGFSYSDVAIETALMVKGIFSLSLRALEGFLNSLFTLMNVPLTSPDYTSISKRAKKVNVQYRNKIAQVSADGAYDTKGCKATIPPRSNAGLWEPRNEAVEALKAGQLKQWKIDNGYHQRSLAETAMGRYKQLNSPMLSLRDYNGQLQRHWPV